MFLKELTHQEFNSFKDNFNYNSMYQSVPYGLVMKNQNFEPLFLGLVDENNILAATLILLEKKGKIKYGYVPRGFLIDYNNFELLKVFTSEIKKYLSRLNVLSIKICPPITRSITDMKYNITSHNNYYDNVMYNLKQLGYKHLGYNNYFEALKPRFEAILDINIPYYILFKNIKKEFRTKIRSAEVKGIKVYKGNVDNVDDLYRQIKAKYPRNYEFFKDTYIYFEEEHSVELYYSKLDTKQHLNKMQADFIEQENKCKYLSTKVSSRNKYNEKYVNLKIEADKELNRIHRALVKATKYLQENPDGIILATAIIIKNKDEIFVLTDGYDKKFKDLNPKHLLVWKLIEHFSKQGYKRINLGAIANPNLDNNEYAGLNYFRLSFNALCYEYIGDFELICNDKLNFIYNNMNIKKILKI